MKKHSHNQPRVSKPSILPKESLEIAERRELLIAGVLGIEDYHTENVRIKTTMGIVEAYGSSVSLCWAGEKRLLLRGHLEGIRFENQIPKKGGCRPCR
ncbi:MAG: YabP/YqfC family sporulation protein [Clostridia bacterium]|nr:YabP/YqfC family sporulation protein [Clostridia bacterium]